MVCAFCKTLSISNLPWSARFVKRFRSATSHGQQSPTTRARIAGLAVASRPECLLANDCGPVSQAGMFGGCRCVRAGASQAAARTSQPPLATNGAVQAAGQPASAPAGGASNSPPCAGRCGDSLPGGRGRGGAATTSPWLAMVEESAFYGAGARENAERSAPVGRPAASASAPSRCPWPTAAARCRCRRGI
jgi:hypothetical protein